MKTNLVKEVKIKKSKVIALEMNIALRQNDIKRMQLNIQELIAVYKILEENIEILKKPGIITRIGALQEAQSKSLEVFKEISYLRKKIREEEKKLIKTTIQQQTELQELDYMILELETPANILQFQRKNVG
jgi:hypothetical protein